MRTALTIAGSDPSGGAGIQADLKTFAAFGVYGLSAVTAVTAQSTVGVSASLPLPADLVTAQIEAVAGDIAVHATKTGMLATAAIVEAVAAAIEELDLPLVVVDPVMLSGEGQPLLDADGILALRSRLLPLARVVTPNLPEAEAIGAGRVVSVADVRDLARRIRDAGPAVVITGGHAPHGSEVVDVLLDGDTFYEFRTTRIAGVSAHGTGCTFASAVAAALARGRPLPEAVAHAQRYVAGAIAQGGLRLGHGQMLIDHFWQLKTTENTEGTARTEHTEGTVKTQRNGGTEQ
jgi:hydroxymethylpyrimidine/phosphomethylpyrimidine kinase